MASIVNTLKEHGAMEYTVVVAANASDPAALQYFAPLRSRHWEYFRDTGRHALVVYDDLSKQAVAYREVSLILRRPSGREALSGRYFLLLDSCLLERAAKIINQQEVAEQMNDLPESLKGKVERWRFAYRITVIETQAAMSGLYSTNVISITDGQIFSILICLIREPRPSTWGISVSRVGGNAQIKSMKKWLVRLKLIRLSTASWKLLPSLEVIWIRVTAMTIDKGQKNTRLLVQPLRTNANRETGGCIVLWNSWFVVEGEP